MVAHILYFFSKQDDLIFDPMAGGGVCADTCLALGRRCWSLDMDDRPDTRPEIEPYHWNQDCNWEDLPIIKSSDWRDFQNCPADEENPGQSILVVEYYEILKKTG